MVWLSLSARNWPVIRFIWQCTNIYVYQNEFRYFHGYKTYTTCTFI
jgi:hypothetical protein